VASDHSGIEWTEATWNPTSGCTKVSPGCDRCYAERITRRFPKTFPNGFSLTLRPDSLDIPLHWKRPRTIFVNSMSDLFHSDVPEEYLHSVFDVMARTPHHTYQILTKRAERLARIAKRLVWPRNVWMGVSVESSAVMWRIDYLKQVPSAVRFVSAEPLLSPLPQLELDGIDWLIAGGESQSGCRIAQLDWFRELRDQCSAADVAFFLKQLGGHPSKRGGQDAVLDGCRWTQTPITRRGESIRSRYTDRKAAQALALCGRIHRALLAVRPPQDLERGVSTGLPRPLPRDNRYPQRRRYNL
jgi:protein gp37